MNRLACGAVAGAAGATVWTVSEPMLRRVFRTPYSDVRLAGRLVTSGRLWPVAGIVAHTTLGAGLGAVLAGAELTGPLRAVLAAQAENLAAWPVMALADRYHPDRQHGNWPRLLTSGRVFAQSAAARALFGLGFAHTFGRLASRT